MLKKVIKKIRYSRLRKASHSLHDLNHTGNSLPKGQGPEALSKWYEAEILRASSHINELERSIGIDSTCHKGCSKCCQHIIFINPVEYELIKYNIGKIDPIIGEDIRLKAAEICDIVRTAKLPIKFTEEFSPNEQGSIKQSYFEKNLECPLLGENKECLIYNIRPLVCLTYRSYGNKKQCALTYTPQYGHAYIGWGSHMTSTMYENYPVQNEKHQLLAFALTQILS